MELGGPAPQIQRRHLPRRRWNDRDVRTLLHMIEIGVRPSVVDVARYFEENHHLRPHERRNPAIVLKMIDLIKKM